MDSAIKNPALATAAQTILRVVIGFLFAAHGWQKYFQFTLDGTTAAFGQMGIPAAGLVAPVVATLEIVGGIALILGVLTRIFAVLLTANMLGAIFLVHISAGVFVEAGGYELVLALAAGAAAIALLGAGRISVDRFIPGRIAA
ncbi:MULTISPECIES: DoxX family protein [Paeniglutamicibacter]|uniref:Oxidoreductase n=1 Tax=Paeniglutamicibacter sulfureus TaxID=43666 RepID=A0ABU2BM34_9MICC|nr:MULTISPECIES: DoxX family protein [Paeniglutamicibacter]MCV9996119.1 DoxX family protein [Paeniglutamicibacter sp. ZC-3]MDO2935387.1 DoxX family protein [Paeniglutamicibacter sulfureus]MDR7359722.1 putative oxidoreductase [Paeniglutamicibacter sulfureus]